MKSVFSQYDDDELPPSIWQGGDTPSTPPPQGPAADSVDAIPAQGAPAPSVFSGAPPDATGPTLLRRPSPNPSGPTGAPPPPNVPQVFSPLDQNENAAQAKLQKLQWQDQNPWGTPQNHPGVLGKIAHGASVAGQIAGSIFAPHVLADTPGTEAYRQIHEQKLGQEVNDIEKEKVQNQESQAQAADLTARAGQTIEQTKELPEKTQSEEGLQGAQTEEAKSRTAQLDQQTKALTQSSAPLDPGTAQQLETMYAPIKKQLGITAPIFQPGMPPAMRDKALDALKSLAELSEKHQEHQDTIGWQRQVHADDEGDKAATRGLTAQLANQRMGAADKKVVYTAYQPTMEAAGRFNTMAQNAIDAIKNHDQQAMLSLLTNHIGMTLGAQKGARITKDILHEATESAPWLQNVQKQWDPKTGLLSGVKLSPQQINQMLSLAREKYATQVQTSRNEAKYYGAEDDGPERTPTPAVANYYKSLAGGDGAKAKALAQKDGWSIQ